MTIGPVEYIELAFPGNQFKGEILPALQDLVDQNLINIIDLVIVKKDADGSVTYADLAEIDSSEADLLEPLHAEVSDLLNADDIMLLAEELPNNYTAALLVWENVWATRFLEAVQNAGGILVANARVPHDVVLAAIEAANS
ncbi:MAG: DUF6325 family protein [Anaerolineae bacterium]